MRSWRGGARGWAWRAGWLLLGLCCALPAGAAEPMPTGPTHRGIVTVGDYQIFPENRTDNAVYAGNDLLLTLPGQAILDVAGLGSKGRFAYLARDASQNQTFAVHVLPGDPEPRIRAVAPGFNYITASFDGSGYKKLFRVDGRSLVDLMSASHTVDGVTVGSQYLAFYFVATAEAAENGQGKNFGLRLHIVPLSAGKGRPLSQPIVNTLPSLKLAWQDATHLTYTLANGQSETVDASHLP